MPYSKKRAESCSEKPLFWIFVYKIRSSLGPTQNTKGPRAKPPPPPECTQWEMPRAWLSRGQREGTAENGRHLLLRKTHRTHRRSLWPPLNCHPHPGVKPPPKPSAQGGRSSPGRFPLRGAPAVQSARPSLVGARGAAPPPDKDSVLSIHDNSSADRSVTHTQGAPPLKGNHYTTHLPVTTSLVQIPQILAKSYVLQCGI